MVLLWHLDEAKKEGDSPVRGVFQRGEVIFIVLLKMLLSEMCGATRGILSFVLPFFVLCCAVRVVEMH